MLKKLCLSLMGLVLIPTLSFALNVKLTDSLSRTTTGFPIEPSISKHGRHVYLVYEINVDNTTVPPTNLAAEIFANKHGLLQSVATLTGDPNFPSVDDGFANPGFTRFSLLDDDVSSTVRIRLFDQNFNLQAENSFNDFAAGDPSNPSFSALGGEFSSDGKYIVMTYLTNAIPNNQTTIIRILDATDLSEVASTQVSGGSLGSNFFSHHDENYVVLATYGGDFIFAFENPLAAPPSTLWVFKLKNNQLTLVDQAPLPQQGNVPSVSKSRGKTLIGIGTVRAVLPGETTIFASDANNQSFLPKDNNELRIYSFDGRRLRLTLARDTGLTTISPVFSSKGLILVNEQVTDGVPGFFNLFSFTNQRGSEQELRLVKGTFASAPFATDVFSSNGKWLVVTGSDQIAELNNINLYRIGSKSCKN